MLANPLFILLIGRRPVVSAGFVGSTTCGVDLSGATKQIEGRVPRAFWAIQLFI
jgi:hypothetical protein